LPWSPIRPSGAPPEVCQKFRSRPNWQNWHRHCIQSSFNFHRVGKCEKCKIGLDFSTLAFDALRRACRVITQISVYLALRIRC